MGSHLGSSKCLPVYKGFLATRCSYVVKHDTTTTRSNLQAEVAPSQISLMSSSNDGIIPVNDLKCFPYRGTWTSNLDGYYKTQFIACMDDCYTNTLYTVARYNKLAT